MNAPLPDLTVLGSRLKIVDALLITLLHRRRHLGLLVEAYKRENGGKLYRPEVEAVRLREAEQMARRLGLNPDFVRALYYFVMTQTIKDELVEREKGQPLQVPPIEREERHAFFRANLLMATEHAAPLYDAHYLGGNASFPVRAYRDKENQVLLQHIRHLTERTVAVDVGCATGPMSELLRSYFTTVVGIDISPHMLSVAMEKKRAQCLLADADHLLPLRSACADLIVANMGTASEVRDLAQFLCEIRRVLKDGGLALLSFYNQNALIYQFPYIPWEIGMNAGLNLQRECLELWLDPQAPFEIFAKARSQSEIEELLPAGLYLSESLTYPTLSTLLPRDLFENDAVCVGLNTIDDDLSTRDFGAFIIAAIRKAG